MNRFEMALLRIIGLPKRATSGILIVQVLLFTLPAIAVGLGFSIGLYVMIAILLNKTLLLGLPLSLPLNAYILSMAVGLIAPLIAVASPIHSLTKQSLTNSLDYQHAVYLIR